MKSPTKTNKFIYNLFLNQTMIKYKTMDKERNNWFDYYHEHYLKTVAELYIKNNNISFDFIKEVFKESKNIKNQRERKKILKTIYHNYDIEHPFFNNSYRTLMLLIKDNITSSVFSYYLKKENFKDYSEVLENIDIFNKLGEPDIKIPKKYSKLKEYTQKINTHLDYPVFFNNIKNCINGFKLEPVNDLNETFKLSKLYNNCWQSSMRYLVKNNNFFLINLKDKENNLIGTLRYLKDSKDTIHLSGWVNPKQVHGMKCYEFSEFLLQNISKNIYKASKEEAFNPNNMRIELHYKRSQKTITDLYHRYDKKYSVQRFFKKKIEDASVQPKNRIKPKLKMN